jgi:restriction system protein
MARRNRSTVLEDVIQLVAKLPWWLGVFLALISYLWLHNVASQPIVPPPTDLKHVGDMVTSQIWRTLATYLQYIIPFACIIGAGISAFQGIGKSKSSKDVSLSSAPKLFTQGHDSTGPRVVETIQNQAVPDCPQCGSSMVKRTAKKGSNAGEMFWGCTSYPKCKGTRASVK